MRKPTTRYRTVLSDSARWESLAFRDGDIVISTPPKSGTTWTQMICALLIFQSTNFPRALDAMSLWPEALFRPQDEVLGELAEQRHRRFMKTHVPLDGLPYDERVTYICVGRDPRDAAISWDNHVGNTNFPVVAARRATAGPQEPDVVPPPPGTLDQLGTARDRFWAWVDSSDKLLGLSAMLHHLSTFWQARAEPNIVLMHYQEMREDLDGNMRRLAGRLGIEIPEDRWPELVRAAQFDQMKSRADELTPEIDIWRDHHRFFHRGASGQWRELLDADDVRRYRDRVRELADDDLANWVHRGELVA